MLKGDEGMKRALLQSIGPESHLGHRRAQGRKLGFRAG